MIYTANLMILTALVEHTAKSTANDSNPSARHLLAKLDYLSTWEVSDLLTSALIYESPMVDMGYGIPDYYDIHPAYRTLADVDKFISELHNGGTKLMTDLVVSHTLSQVNHYAAPNEATGLNWENPGVRWFLGFRMDVINLIPKYRYFADGPRLHEFFRGMRKEVLDKYDTVTVGETPYVYGEAQILRVVHPEMGSLDMTSMFEHTEVDSEVKRITNRLQHLMIEHNGWNSIFCENHDSPRAVTRFTDDSDEYREELGMRNVPLSWLIEGYKDVEALNYWKRLAIAENIMRHKVCDNAHTPIQWGSSPNAGFCPVDVRPWMRVNDDYRTVNPAEQLANVFVYGDFELLDLDHSRVYAYRRFSNNEAWVLVLNFLEESVDWDCQDLASLLQVDRDISTKVKLKEWVVGNYKVGNPEHELNAKIRLRP
ncbi:glycoside hydrolase family 13 protein [Glonium stellatum]|uniref:Glycoside hydrolase family 13 protein n=1 Tax=Glonium stellatum TaxID=574774 RepID=A0A8E2EV14_9PEZI|nr:glycoside hydrolase family 13 protein [Glonium stellatum]